MLRSVSGLAKGTSNLLVNCGGARAGETVLIVREPAGLGYYDEAIVMEVAAAAHRLGTNVSVVEVGFDPRATAIPDGLKALMADANLTVFLARIGDQLRFSEAGAKGRAVISYALDAPALGSRYGAADYAAFVELKDAVNRMLRGARRIRVTCPRGTDFEGDGRDSKEPAQDVGLRRFPMPVFTPVSARHFSGVVALPGFLVGTGSMYYDPYGIGYEGDLRVEFANGRIVRFLGDAKAVGAAEAHYDFVAGAFGLDRDFVHSWHGGIHPGCEYQGHAADSYERWSGSAFGNPRVLHFHTCGAMPPGEISWNIIDPTVEVDGIVVWHDGVFDPRLVPGGHAVLEAHPDVREVFENPGRNIGL